MVGIIIFMKYSSEKSSMYNITSGYRDKVNKISKDKLDLIKELKDKCLCKLLNM